MLAAPVGKESKRIDKTTENNDFYDFKSINFVGNDYICYDRDIESTSKGDNALNASHSLEVVPLDTVYTRSEVPMVASRVLGEKGIEGLNSGAKSYLRTVSQQQKSLLKDTPLPTGFGIFRRNGKWLLRGRLNYSIPSVKNEYADFNVPMVAPENLVNYDSLFPSWEVIKQKVPSAVDGFTSPNKDIVVVLTKSKLLVYAIKDNVLGNLSLKELELKNSEVAVMSQWATDNYVKIWSEDVRKAQGK